MKNARRAIIFKKWGQKYPHFLITVCLLSALTFLNFQGSMACQTSKNVRKAPAHLLAVPRLITGSSCKYATDGGDMI